MIKRIIDNKVVRYFFSAGTATIVDVMVYFVTFNFILQKQDIPFIKPLVITAPIASLVISYSCGLMTNFIITKYMVFTDSILRGRHQLMRYILVALVILVLNYLLMKFLIHILHWYPTVSRIFSALSIGVLSFIFHKFYSFKGAGKVESDSST
jgi:putative flippase GtrA